uniref:SH3 domain-containing protein n=1 Tax=Serinus canaria TaxID=9135 RepID=A0A8C9MYH5_SERCA
TAADLERPHGSSLVLVEYGFEYRAKDGTLVSIKPNERYVLLKRTNPHWWHVRRSGDARAFYIPAQYVKELPPIAPAALVPQPPPAYEYQFISAAEPGETAGGCPVPRKDSVLRRDSVPRRDSVLQRDSGPPPHTLHPHPLAGASVPPPSWAPLSSPSPLFCRTPWSLGGFAVIPQVPQERSGVRRSRKG